MPQPDAFLGRHPLIAFAERVARDHDEADLVAARRHGAVEAALVQHQTDIRGAIIARDARHDRLGVGHLRHALRIDEAGHFHAFYAGRHQPADEPDLRLGGEFHLLILKPVPGADIDESHEFRSHCHLEVLRPYGKGYCQMSPSRANMSGHNSLTADYQ
jgi:hypothetical protein